MTLEITPAYAVPLAVLMLLLAELRGAGGVWLHAAGILLVVSRMLHPLGLKADAPSHPLRILGNTGSLLALVICVAGIVYSYLG